MGKTVTVTGNMTVNAPYTMAAGTLNVNGNISCREHGDVDRWDAEREEEHQHQYRCSQFPTTGAGDAERDDAQDGCR
jgi:hypothetical protein